MLKYNLRNLIIYNAVSMSIFIVAKHNRYVTLLHGANPVVITQLPLKIVID